MKQTLDLSSRSRAFQTTGYMEIERMETVLCYNALVI